MNDIGKNVFKGIVLHKVSRENSWGPTLFWGLILYSQGFRKFITTCVLGFILIWVWGQSLGESEDDVKSKESLLTNTQEILAPPSSPQFEVVSSVVENVEGGVQSEVFGTHANTFSQQTAHNFNSLVCEVTGELRSSETCAYSSILALTNRYEALVSIVEARGDLLGGNYAENRKVISLLAECENEQCKKEVLFSGIDVFKNEVLK